MDGAGVAPGAVGIGAEVAGEEVTTGGVGDGRAGSTTASPDMEISEQALTLQGEGYSPLYLKCS